VPAGVVVQIVNYATREHLARLLPGLLADLRDAGVPSRVLVLDNDSGDDLGPLAARHPEVEFHRAPRNLGFGAGHNHLARRHDAPALLLLNPDVVLTEPRTVARLLAVLAEGPEVAAVGPQLVHPGGVVDRWDHGELHGARARLARAAGHSHGRLRHDRADVAWVSGACALLSRAHFDAVGGFDPGFFLYKEEEDLCLRMRARGGRVVYEPAIHALHHGSVTGMRTQALEASVRRFQDKHVRSRLQRRLLPPINQGVVVADGWLRRLTGRRA